MRLPMKPGTSLAMHDALAQHAVAERAHGFEHLGGGVGGGDQFEQVKVARRIVEMRAQEAAAESLASAPWLCTAMGMPLELLLKMRVGARRARSTSAQRSLLGLGFLDDGLDDPVRVGEARRGCRRCCPG